MLYSNKQIGTALLLIMGSTIFINLYIAMTSNNAVMWLVTFLLSLVAFLFYSLNIQVTSTAISWAFGPGFWKKSINIDSIKSAKIIKTRWFYGLGIRLIPTGWLYLVSGTTAIELNLKSGSKVSLGTNDAPRLLQVLQSQLKIDDNSQ